MKIIFLNFFTGSFYFAFEFFINVGVSDDSYFKSVSLQIISMTHNFIPVCQSEVLLTELPVQTILAVFKMILWQLNESFIS